MVFYCISPLAIYTKDSRLAAPSIITPYTNDANQPCMNWDSEVEKQKQKKHTSETVQVQWTARTLTKPEKASLKL